MCLTTVCTRTEAPSTQRRWATTAASTGLCNNNTYVQHSALDSSINSLYRLAQKIKPTIGHG